MSGIAYYIRSDWAICVAEFEYTKKTAQSYIRDRKGTTKEVFGKYGLGLYSSTRIPADQCAETLPEALSKAETLLVRRMHVKQTEVNDLNSRLGEIRSMIRREQIQKGAGS